MLGAIAQARAPFYHGLLAAHFDAHSAVTERSPRSNFFRYLGVPIVAKLRELYERWSADRGLELDVAALAYVLSRLAPGDQVVIGVRTESQVLRIRAILARAQQLVAERGLVDLPTLRVGEGPP